MKYNDFLLFQSAFEILRFLGTKIKHVLGSSTNHTDPCETPQFAANL